MTDTAPQEPREIELVFDDEPARADSAPRSTTPRFEQSARARSSRAERAAGASSGAAGPFASMPTSGAESATLSTSALAEGRVPSSVLGGSLLVTGVAGIFAANVSGAAAIPAFTSTLSAATGLLASFAALATAAFSSIGAMLLVLIAWTGLRRRGERGTASAMLLAMWTAWMLSGAVAAVSLGAVPFIVSPIAFLAAATAFATSRARSHSLARAWELGLGGTVLVAGVAALLIASGSATLVGALASLLVGASSALLGVRAWNRWWAPMFDAREQMRRTMSSAWRARMA